MSRSLSQEDIILRDDLAKAALIGRLGHPHWANCQMRTAITQGGCPAGDFPPEFYAAIYRDADAMLVARGREPVRIIGDWLYVTSPTVPPLANEVRVNQQDPNFALATTCWLWNVTVGGRDCHGELMQAVGELTLQDTQDPDRHMIFKITGTPIDRGTYVEVPILAVSAGSMPLQSERIFVQFYTLLRPA